MDKKVISVTMLNKYIKTLVDTDCILSSVMVSGEISNFKEHSSGHAYFTLKDEASSIKCVMFRSSYRLLLFKVKNGDKVIISGNISVYEKEGQYQLYCNKIQIDGVGSLYVAYEQLKDKLYQKGWFDSENKKKLPAFPKRIGVITSPTGAVIRDIINVSGRRFYNNNILIIPSLVQGKEAVPSLINAINNANKLKDIDVLIIARGGGSIEDLWCFNDESVAEAVFKSKIPVVSAVGHETDFTICDFVSDLRAPTPSAAAEIVIPEFNNLMTAIYSLEQKAIKSMEYKLMEQKTRLQSLQQNRFLKNPDNIINDRFIRLDNIAQKIINSQINLLREKKHLYTKFHSKLEVLNPAFVLAKGYSIVTDDNQKIIKSVDAVNQGDNVSVKISDGTLICTVNEIEGKN